MNFRYMNSVLSSNNHQYNQPTRFSVLFYSLLLAPSPRLVRGLSKECDISDIGLSGLKIHKFSNLVKNIPLDQAIFRENSSLYFYVYVYHYQDDS